MQVGINVVPMSAEEYRAVKRVMLELYKGDIERMATDTGLNYSTLVLWRDGTRKLGDKPIAFLSFFLRERAQDIEALIHFIESEGGTNDNG